jgi:hypothetical protein
MRGISHRLLNYAKILEVLFPGPSGRTIDSARAGLAELRFLTGEIEAWFVPALALRNNIDVAHVSLAVFKQGDLEVLHKYSGGAEGHFRTLLARVCDEVATGRWELPEYRNDGPSDAVSATIEGLRAALQNAP